MTPFVWEMTNNLLLSWLNVNKLGLKAFARKLTMSTSLHSNKTSGNIVILLYLSYPHRSRETANYNLFQFLGSWHPEGYYLTR